MKHYGSPDLNDGDMEIDVNNQGQEPSIAPAQTNVKWHWWGSEWCALGTCNKVTFVIGIEDTPLYTDWPYASCKEYPGWPFDYTKYFTAPTEEGSYRIFGIFCPVNTKDEAIQYYLAHPELRFQVGTLIVTPAPPPECITDADCPAGLVCKDGKCVPVRRIPWMGLILIGVGVAIPVGWFLYKRLKGG